MRVGSCGYPGSGKTTGFEALAGDTWTERGVTFGRTQVPDDQVAFVAVQTVFEGHEVNTAERAVASVAQHGLDGIPIGHDVDPLGGPPSMMRLYRTGGTPWTVIIGPERRVCFDGFQIEPPSAAAIIGQLLA